MLTDLTTDPAGPHIFDRASALVVDRLPRLPAARSLSEAPICIGEYTYHGGGHNNAGSPFFSFSGPEVYEARVSYVGSQAVPMQVHDFGVRIGHQFWHVKSNSISVKQLEGDPKFSYQWLGDRKEKYPSGLTVLRVDLGENSFVTYDLMGDKLQRSRFAQGDESLTIQCPEDLTGQTEILGVQIPWDIDFAHEAERLLRASHLIDFLNAEEAMRTGAGT